MYLFEERIKELDCQEIYIIFNNDNYNQAMLQKRSPTAIVIDQIK